MVGGAVMTAFGHIMLSLLVTLLFVRLGEHYFHEYGEAFEQYSGLVLACFGLAYAIWSYFNHGHCHGHEHHGPDPKKGAAHPLVFLFMVGFSPCVAVLPVFGTAATHGHVELAVTFISFSIGVLAALVSAVWTAARGLHKFDHPVFEHYGDLIAGLVLAAVGILIFLIPHHHHH